LQALRVQWVLIQKESTDGEVNQASENDR
jgi:hypothetical protein